MTFSKVAFSKLWSKGIYGNFSRRFYLEVHTYVCGFLCWQNCDTILSEGWKEKDESIDRGGDRQAKIIHQHTVRPREPAHGLLYLLNSSHLWPELFRRISLIYLPFLEHGCALLHPVVPLSLLSQVQSRLPALFTCLLFSGSTISSFLICYF